MKKHMPDIQLKHAGQVFRMYIKSLRDKSFFRIEKSLALDSHLTKTLESIMSPVREINDLKNMVVQLGPKIDSMSKK